jgi:hypothetical protein
VGKGVGGMVGALEGRSVGALVGVGLSLAYSMQPIRDPRAVKGAVWTWLSVDFEPP